MKKSIVFVHLLNDFSGSPRVLRSVIQTAIRDDNEVSVITSAGDGFLSKIEGCNYKHTSYRFYKTKLIALFAYVIWQLKVFVKVLVLPKRFGTVYINTLHPFGAALAGLVRGNRIIYHIHETSIRPAALKKILRWIVKISSDEIIYVSNFLKDQEKFEGKKMTVIYNALSEEFTNVSFDGQKKEYFEVLMLCSLKAYKGVNDFYDLALRLPDIHFTLVLNASKAEVEDFFSVRNVPSNLILQSVVRDVHPYYRKASLVMNLSHRDQWVETFGMTIAEAFAYGLPAIVPEVGGIAELVEDHVNGYKINHDKTEVLYDTIKRLASDQRLYSRLSLNATNYASRFDRSFFEDRIRNILIG